MTWFRRSVHPEEDLSAYVDGELGERARRVVETHLASCEACSALVRELQDTKSLLGELPRVEPRRSLALGREFAVERRVAPASRRPSFTFAPAVALTILVGLLFVDAIDTTGGSSNDGSFSTAGSTTARQAPEAGAGLALEASKAADSEQDPASSATASQAGDASGTGASGTGESSSAGGAAAGAAPAAADSASAADAEASETPVAALAPPSQNSASEPETAPETAPAPLAREADGNDDFAADLPAVAPEETSALKADDSSGGLSTLSILEIVAALAFAASLLAVFLPRIVGRQER